MSTFTGGNLIWLDLEMSGLDPHQDNIVEIATIITDANLKIIAEGPDLVIHQTEDELKNMSHWSREHFTESGLLTSIKLSKISTADAEAQTLDFIKKHCSPQTALLAGSSVHIDRWFLAEHMPKIFNYVHYRIIDVSTIKELSLRWYPNLSVFPKVEPHRAKGDILESINELKYYQTNLFK